MSRQELGYKKQENEKTKLRKEGLEDENEEIRKRR